MNRVIDPSRSLVALAVAAVFASHDGTAAAAEDRATGDEQELEQLIVTGSRIAGRTVLQSEAPIQIFSHEELVRSNKTDLLEALQVHVPSLNLPGTAANGLASRVVRGAFLRSLSPGETLVLVNGKRRHTTASVGAGGSDAAQPVDLGLIPTAAIERVEVLLDGASALYGSDAIAGVINIITRKDNGGGDLYQRVGSYFTGQGFNWSVRGGTGFELGDGGHVYVALEADQRDRTLRGAPVPEGMLYYFPISNTTGLPVNPAARPGGASATGSAIAGALSAPFLPAGARPDPREATRNDALQQIAGQTPYQLYAGSVDASLPVGEDTELYSLLTYSWRSAQSFNGFRLPDRNEVVRAFYPDGYSPINTQLEKDFEATFGARGSFGEWGWDLSSGYGGNYASIGSSNTVNPSFGLQSQRSFHIGKLGFQSWVSNFDLRRSFDLPFSVKPAEFSAGLEYRRDYLQIHAGDYQAYANGGQVVLDGPNAGTPLSGPGGNGAQATYGYRPQEAADTDRRNNAVYLGVAFYPTGKWLINVAGRNEDYSDVGNTWTGRLSTRFDITPEFAVRGTVSSGFQAPTLGTQAMQKLQNWGTYIGYTLPVASQGAQDFGAVPLKPEKSRSYSAGFMAQLPWNINLTLDAYQVDADDRIALSNQIRYTTISTAGFTPAQQAANRLAVQQLLLAAGVEGAALPTPNNASLNFFINAASTRSRGVEATLESTFGLGDWGRLRWNLSANYNKTSIREEFTTPPALAQYGVQLFAPSNRNTLQYLAPRDKEVLALTWTRRNLSVTLRETHIGSLPRFSTVTNWNYPDQLGQAFQYNSGRLFITDLDAIYNVSEHFAVTAGVTNLFSKKPQKLTGPLTTPTAQWAFDETGPITSDGGSYVAGFQFSW